jgi:SAM-dependent methyltransferase
MIQDLNSYFEANKLAWNNKTPVHFNSDFYNIQAFRSGKSSLNKIEIEELGDVSGKTLLHLQCHFGVDTISWARRGAIATGLDFSESAIDVARMLAKEINGNADFVCCNIYDAPQHINDRFDVVYTSYGTIQWLPDLKKWAGIISHFLKPGGIFYMVDFHPIIWMFDEEFKNIRHSYFNSGEPVVEEAHGTYADRNAGLHDVEYTWNHSISDVLNALIHSGLKISFFNEYNYSPYNCFNNMVETAAGEWKIKGFEDKIPLVFSLSAKVG